MRSIPQLRTPEGRGTGDGGTRLIANDAPAHREVRFREPQIEMAHGAGGKATRRLIDGLFAPLLYEAKPAYLGDSALVEGNGQMVTVTTDGFVVTPLSFPGGSIGGLAVNGTVNDLAVAGARPTALLASFVLEAGLPTEILEAEVRAMAETARLAGVPIVGGDTKVVEHGKTDKMYITTTGLGSQMPDVKLGPEEVRVGDKIILSGPIGDHGITILLARGELDLEADIHSDTRSVYPLVAALANTDAPALHWMRDPTRGGVATTLNELAIDCRLGVLLSEEAIPVRAEVRGACELLGLDPLHIANEGQFMAVVDASAADRLLEVLRGTPGGGEARIIGEIRDEPAGAVLAASGYGGTRIVDMLVGDPLPRIC